ncbi:hypothetical protein [Sorangium sp. So ce1182]|uniref:hypothetical protein n=1 Tax=Sorangium sp. So ce1182 TaxID=3133334 RepID=UPI003F5F626F
MKTIQDVLLCAPLFGLFALALPGCPGESSGQEPEAQPPLTEVFCDRLAECGVLDEHATAEQCAAKLGPAFATLHEGDDCGSMTERIESLMTCAAQQLTCEELADGEGESVPEDHPCYDENESYKKAFEEAKEQGTAAHGCALYAGAAVKSAMLAPPGTECTTTDECPEIWCPDGAGPGSGCNNGWCMTEKELCE